MKNLTTISLFIFGVVVVAILTAGLVFNQNKKDNQIAGLQSGSVLQNILKQNTSPGKSLILSIQEVSNHNKQADCWLVISNKVYNITSYFGSHPGGSGAMAATCGTDATIAYSTKDPYAQSTSGGKSHSSSAKNLLNNYYLGDLNQTIGVQNPPSTNNITSPVDNQTVNTPTVTTPSINTVKKVISLPVVKPSPNLTLDMAEIAKHNKQSDCWMLISGKVYNITSFFGSHPGGSGTMAATCGKDATDAYMTKDPYATSSGSRSAHSSNAVSLLSNYYIGDFSQTISPQKVIQTSTVVAPSRRGGDNEYDD